MYLRGDTLYSIHPNPNDPLSPYFFGKMISSNKMELHSLCGGIAIYTWIYDYLFELEKK